MPQRANKLNLALRPNIKTHKSLEIGILQQLGGSLQDASDPKIDCSTFRIGTSTLKESEFFLKRGYGDVLYCVPLAGEAKVKRAAELHQTFKGAFSIMVDSIQGVEQLNTAFNVFVKVDCGYHRAGRSGKELQQLVSFIQQQQQQHITLRGFYCHGGHSYHLDQDPSHVLQQELQCITQPHQHSLIRSIGSTPTCSVLKQESSNVNEMHPGCYVFFDRMQAQIGSCCMDDIACFVLSTIIGIYPERNEMLLDAGSRMLGTDVLEGKTSSKWGVIANYQDSIQLNRISQEVCVASSNDMDLSATFKVGDTLRILPNHCCLTATNFERYHIFNDDLQPTGQILHPCKRGV